MKKSLVTTLILLLLSGCQSQSNQNTSDYKEDDRALTNSQVSLTITDSTAQSNATEKVTDQSQIKHTTTQVAGLKIEGVIDADALQKNISVASSATSNNQNSTSIISGKKGLSITDKGFIPTKVEVPLGAEFLIFNQSEVEVKLNSTDDCPELDNKLLKAGEVLTITFDKTKTCPIKSPSNLANSATKLSTDSSAEISAQIIVK